jgi:hypothetical protein
MKIFKNVKTEKKAYYFINKIMRMKPWTALIFRTSGRRYIMFRLDDERVVK